MLGQGNYGVVTRGELQSAAKSKAAGTPVAIKTLISVSDAILTQFLVEARLLAVMDHPHVIRLLGVQAAFQPVQLMLEYCELGDLLRYVRSGAATEGVGQRGGFDAAQLDMARQVASGLAYLHGQLCVHRDVAARNVVVTAAGGQRMTCGVVLKLTDLGLTRALRSEADYYKVRGVGRRGVGVRGGQERESVCVCVSTLR